MEESFDLMEPGIEKKVPEDKEPVVMKNTFKDLGVIIGFIFIYIILYQYVSTGDISNGIDLQNDVNLILSDTQNFSFVPGSVPSSLPASGSSPSSVPASGSSSSPSSVPASGSSSSPSSVPASGSSSSPSSVPASGSSSSPSSVPASGSSSSPSSIPASGASSSPSSIPASGASSPTSAPSPAPTSAPSPAPTSAPSPAPTSAPSPAPTSAPSPAPTSAPSPAPTSAPSPAPTSAPSPVPTESPNPIINKPKIYSIRMDINGFYPNVISINKSDTIIWTNVEDQRPRVVLLSKDGLFKNQVLIENNRFEYKFYKKGNYSFVLVEHPSLIEYQKAKGNVIVN